MNFREYKDDVISIIEDYGFNLELSESVINDEYFLFVTYSPGDGNLQISFEGYLRTGDWGAWWNLDQNFEITRGWVVRDTVASADKVVNDLDRYLRSLI